MHQVLKENDVTFISFLDACLMTSNQDSKIKYEVKILIA